MFNLGQGVGSRNNAGGLPGALHVAVNHRGDQFAAQQTSGSMGLLNPKQAQGFIRCLKNPEHIAVGLTVAQKIKALAGDVKCLRGGDLK